MAEGYTRQSTFSNGDVIDAALFNDEFNQLVEAFKKDVGHNHDGTTGGGAPVPFIEKGNSGVYIDTNVPTAPKIIFKINGVTVSEAGGVYGYGEEEPMGEEAAQGESETTEESDIQSAEDEAAQDGEYFDGFDIVLLGDMVGTEGCIS